MSKKHISEDEASSRPEINQDVIDTPSHLVAELIDGRLYTRSRPASRHAFAETALASILNPPLHFSRGGPGGWWILFEPELQLGENILVPDLAGWRRQRMSQLPDIDETYIVPDWICEVLSPSTLSFDLGRKSDIYARAGVDYMWLVDPNTYSLEAFKLQGSDWELIDSLYGDVPVSLPPFEEISFDLGDLWLRTVHEDLPGMLFAEPQIEQIGTSTQM